MAGIKQRRSQIMWINCCFGYPKCVVCVCLCVYLQVKRVLQADSQFVLCHMIFRYYLHHAVGALADKWVWTNEEEWGIRVRWLPIKANAVSFHSAPSILYKVCRGNTTNTTSVALPWRASIWVLGSGTSFENVNIVSASEIYFV